MVNSPTTSSYYLRFTIYALLLHYVGQAKRHFLYYSLSGDWPCANALAVDSARHARSQRLGQQLFPAVCRAQNRLACVANGCRFRMDAWSSFRRRHLEYWNCLLGNVLL